MNKILLIDIENLADQAWVWGHYEQNVIKVIRHGHLLSCAYKWLGKKTEVIGQDDAKGYKPRTDNDLNIVKELWWLLDQAEYVVAHNGKSFDVKKINARFIYHNLPPPSPYRVIDTKLEVKRVARFESNKLDDLGAQLVLGRKLDHEGWELWEGCYNGDKKSWAKMKAYNKQDVDLLERLFLRIRGWIPSLSLGLYSEQTICPKCGSSKLQSRGWYFTKTAKYKRIQCQSCFGWSRLSQSERIQKPLVSL